MNIRYSRLPKILRTKISGLMILVMLAGVGMAIEALRRRSIIYSKLAVVHREEKELSDLNQKVWMGVKSSRRGNTKFWAECDRRIHEFQDLSQREQNLESQCRNIAKYPWKSIPSNE